MENVVENIKQIRLEKSISQQIIADALSVDVSAVSNIENGKRELRVSELAKIAKALRVDVIDLFTYPDKYVKANKDGDEPMEAVLQIKLKKDKRDQVMKLVFGDNDIEILNK